MKIAVWDTYVSRDDGRVMHFDILVPAEMTDHALIQSYAQDYLSGKAFGKDTFSMERCNFCHHEVSSVSAEADIQKKGFHIIEMENCH